VKLTLKTLWMHVVDDGDCMIWRHSVNSSGYPQACLDGRAGYMVRRYIFCSLLGKQLGQRQRVAASCDNPRCVNPDHLLRRTYSDTLKRSYANGQRKASLALYQAHGIRLSGSRVTPDMVDQILIEPRDVPHAEIARRYGLSAKVVSHIRRGITFRRTRPPVSVFDVSLRRAA
jgi:hypothetical protein